MHIKFDRVNKILFPRLWNWTLVTLGIKLTFNVLGMLKEQKIYKYARTKSFSRNIFIRSFLFWKMHILCLNAAVHLLTIVFQFYQLLSSNFGWLNLHLQLSLSHSHAKQKSNSHLSLLMADFEQKVLTEKWGKQKMIQNQNLKWIFIRIINHKVFSKIIELLGNKQSLFSYKVTMHHK